MVKPHKNNWSRTRQQLILVGILLGGLCVFTLKSGRPGDVGAGILGRIIGALAVCLVVGVELAGRFFLKKGPGYQKESRLPQDPFENRLS